MIRSLFLGAGLLALTAGAASAQTVYVTPGYAVPAYTVAPTYVAPPVAIGPPVVVRHYYMPRAAVTVAPPLYDYAPAYAAPVTIEDDDWAD